MSFVYHESEKPMQLYLTTTLATIGLPAMLLEFGVVILYIALAAAFLLASLVIGYVIRPNKPYSEKLSTYECGEEAIGSSFIQFNVRFYIIALIFLIFDVEIILLFPWAVIYHKVGLLAFIEMSIFILILLAGYIYVWKDKDLEWLKSEQVTTNDKNAGL